MTVEQDYAGDIEFHDDQNEVVLVVGTTEDVIHVHGNITTKSLVVLGCSLIVDGDIYASDHIYAYGLGIKANSITGNEDAICLSLLQTAQPYNVGPHSTLAIDPATNPILKLKLKDASYTPFECMEAAGWISTELKERYRKQLESYWCEERDGVVETELRNKIQQAASEIELKLNSLGSVRTTRINNELYYAEIDLSTSGTLETLVRFLGRIQEIRPALSWRRLDLRPEMRNTDLIGNMNFNGAIRIIGFDGEEPDRKGGTK